jgi:hypothetical protein
MDRHGGTARSLAIALGPFVLVAIGARALVPRIGDAMARRLATWASIVVPIEQEVAPAARHRAVGPAADAVSVFDRAAAGAADAVSGFDRDAPSAARAAVPRRTVATGERTTAGASKRGPRKILIISGERLQHLAQEQLRGIQATTAVDAQGRPAGVRLSSVVALGVGLAEGDVVTSIDSRPTPTPDDATAAAAVAWSSGARTARAIIVRGEETIAVTVEIPLTKAGPH